MNLANRLLLGSLLIGLVCTVDPRNADVLYSTSVVTVKSTDGGAQLRDDKPGRSILA